MRLLTSSIFGIDAVANQRVELILVLANSGTTSTALLTGLLLKPAIRSHAIVSCGLIQDHLTHHDAETYLRLIQVS
jgi:hypothetical protein